MLASSGTVVVTAWQGEEERVREAWWVAGDRDTKGGGECKVFTSSRATTARQKGEEEGEANT